jgi:hypothetical protein
MSTIVKRASASHWTCAAMLWIGILLSLQNRNIQNSINRGTEHRSAISKGTSTKFEEVSNRSEQSQKIPDGTPPAYTSPFFKASYESVHDPKMPFSIGAWVMSWPQPQPRKSLSRSELRGWCPSVQSVQSFSILTIYILLLSLKSMDSVDTVDRFRYFLKNICFFGAQDCSWSWTVWALPFRQK